MHGPADVVTLARAHLGTFAAHQGARSDDSRGAPWPLAIESANPLDLHGLPSLVADSIRTALASGYRWYVAHWPDKPRGFLRNKNKPQLAEWRVREWRFSRGVPPRIVDVTKTFPAMWRTLLRLREPSGLFRSSPMYLFRPPKLLTAAYDLIPGFIDVGHNLDSTTLFGRAPGEEVINWVQRLAPRDGCLS